MDNYCNNCGKIGHLFHQCKMPIISSGIIAFRKSHTGELQFLMIRRKDSLGFMDFMRGKYSIYNREYLLNLLKEMTIQEKQRILNNDFPTLWGELWNKSDVGYSQYRAEEHSSSEKFEALKAGITLTNGETFSLADLIEETNTDWIEPEWGFPKGRRNNQETDLDCALREFKEETGISPKRLLLLENLTPFEEIFTGSNYKSYKHKYYVMRLINSSGMTEVYDKNEVSKLEWKTYEECMQCIRPYNLEKKRILENLYYCLMNYKIIDL